MTRLKIASAAATFIVCLAAAQAVANTVTFSGFEHGAVIDDELESSHGLTISAVNADGHGPNLAVVFDSLESWTRDPDLEGPAWATGNLAPNTVLGNMLIIQENGTDCNGDGIMDYPDDEGARPAGSLFLDFAAPITSFGFDIVDVEGPSEFGDDSGYVALFYLGTTPVGSMGFGELIDPNSPFYDPTIQYGDNSANRVSPITAADLGGTMFDRVQINMGGSGAIDNLCYTLPPAVIPEPVTLAGVFAAGGAVGAAAWRRLRRGRSRE